MDFEIGRSITCPTAIAHSPAGASFHNPFGWCRVSARPAYHLRGRRCAREA